MLDQVSPQRIGIAAGLAVIMTVPSLTQFALGALAPFLTAEYHLTPSTLGTVTSAYYLAAAGLSPLMGRWVNRLGTRGALFVTVALGWAGSLAFASAPAFAVVLLSVFVAGAATAMANPATNVAISALPRPHAALVGVKQSGVQVAASIAGAVLPVVAVGHGWRTAVLSCSVGFAVGLVAVLIMPLAKPSQVVAQTSRDAAPAPGARRLALFAGLMGCGIAATNVYLVLYAHVRTHMDVRLAGALLATVGFVAIGARIVYTLVAERVSAPDRTGMRMLRAMAVVAVAATALVAFAPSLGTSALWVGAVAIGMSAAAFNGVLMLVVIRTNKTTSTARTSGLVQAFFFGGLLVSPPVFGFLVDVTGSYAYGWAWAALCLVAAAVVIPSGRALAAAVAAERRTAG
ncbi:MAG TPA: MFS transporter [Streptosporangiales bacterium]